MRSWQYAELTIWKQHDEVKPAKGDRYSLEYAPAEFAHRWHVLAEESVYGGGREVILEKTFTEGVAPSNLYWLGQMGDRGWELVGTRDRKAVVYDENFTIEYTYYFKREA